VKIRDARLPKHRPEQSMWRTADAPLAFDRSQATQSSQYSRSSLTSNWIKDFVPMPLLRSPLP
jgi:hypothetical protein